MIGIVDRNDMDASTSRSWMIGSKLTHFLRVCGLLSDQHASPHRYLGRCMMHVAICICISSSAVAQRSVPDRHSIRWHSGPELSLMTRPANPAPVTVASKDIVEIERLLPLNEAIRIALDHAEVIRVLGDISASNSGQNIYETAIATTRIDNAVSVFDPVFRANSSWRKSEFPGSRLDPLDPLNAVIDSSQTGGNDFTLALQRRNRLGGTAEIEFRNQWQYRESGIGQLSRNNRPALELSYTQPLLSGAGRAFNEAPIVIAQLEVDRSFFSFKGRVQRMLQGVISAYWSLVAARTELWAREKQVEQAKEAFDRVEAQFRAELVDIGDVTQPRLALANFKATLVSARANVIQREAALRNLLGLPPEDGQRLVPSTPPTRNQLEFQWVDLVETAQRRRPDLIELNLVLMADQQRLLQADNQARPSLNAEAIQSWNGLRGTALNQNTISSDMNDNPNWTLGVTFEVPLGLRNSRATLRNRQLTIARDRANISQGLHATEHELATTIRRLDQAYAQYEAFKETRAAAQQNLDVQFAEQKAGRVIFLNVLQAITAWGDAVSSEANALTQYNTTLASLEESTGTILDTHGVVFTEERYASMGYGGRKHEDECYPRSLRPQGNVIRYEDGNEPSEEAFDLRDFDRSKSSPLKPTYDDDPLPPLNAPETTSDSGSSSMFHSASFENLPSPGRRSDGTSETQKQPDSSRTSFPSRLKSLFGRRATLQFPFARRE